MIISFTSRKLRDYALNQFAQMKEFSPEVTTQIQFWLTVLNASNKLADIPNAPAITYLKDSMQIILSDGLKLILISAHNKTPTTQDGKIDWPNISRLKLEYIGK